MSPSAPPSGQPRPDQPHPDLPRRAAPRLNSLRLRLFLTGAAAICAALTLAAFGLAFLFDRHATRVAVADLEARAMALIAMIEPGEAGGIRSRPITLDPRYDMPFSGAYWQISIGGQMMHSRSLWDVTLAPPETAPPAGGSAVVDLDGPQDQALLAVDRSVLVGTGPDARPMRLLVAVDRRALTQAQSAFLGDLLPYLAVLGGFLLLASWVEIRVGLRPLSQIGARIATLDAGLNRRLGEDFPTEVVPLARQIDQLLDDRDRDLARARHRAADLAHGFKTPLQALLGDAEILRARGEVEVAQGIEDVVGVMHRHVDHELARARIHSDHSHARTDPAAIIEKIAKVLARTPRGGEISWRLDAPAGTVARIDGDDLTEALGALMENALRFARTTVSVTVKATSATLAITIRDDGPGVPEAQITALPQRGRRLDQTPGGHGIGLSIAADIIEAARGELVLRNARPGLEVTISLVRAPA